MENRAMPYVYSADLWCDTCGAELCRSLSTPEGYDPENESSWDSGDYPKYAEPEASDAPQHCASGTACPDAVEVFGPEQPHRRLAGAFVNDELTDEGEEYVREAWRNDPSSPLIAEWISHYGVRFEPLDILRLWGEGKGKGDDCPDPAVPTGQPETGRDLAAQLAESDDPEDSIYELAGRLVPYASHARHQWLMRDPSAESWVGEAVSDYGLPEPFTLDALLGLGMSMQYAAALYEVWEAAVEAARDM